MEGSTSSSTDRKLAMPCIKDVTVVWEPNDSIHGGKLFLMEHLTGAPEFEEFFPVGGPVPDWWRKLKGVHRSLEKAFNSSNCFSGEHIAEWREWFQAYPWQGLVSVPAQHRLPFHVPDFPIRQATCAEREAAVAEILDGAGQDERGRLRPFYKHGRDMLRYERAKSLVTYGGFLLDGTKYVPRMRSKQGKLVDVFVPYVNRLVHAPVL